MTDLATKPSEASAPPSTLARLILMKELRRLVSKDGRRPPVLAARMGVGRRTVDRWLNGENQDIKASQVIQLCAVLGHGHDDDTTQQLLQLASAAKQHGVSERFGWFAEYEFGHYLGLEQDARRISTYESTLVPGILQTPDYAEAFMRAFGPEQSDSAIAERVKIRVGRQATLTREDRPAELAAFIDEGALRRVVAGPAVMRDQFAHLLMLGECDNICLQVIPFNAGPHVAAPFGPFVVMWFDEYNGFEGVGPISYVETPRSAQYGETPEQTREYLLMLQRLNEVALNPADSAAMITAAMDAAATEA